MQKKKVQLVENNYFTIYFNMNKLFRNLKIHPKYIWNIFKFNRKLLYYFITYPKKKFILLVP
jgi:hypothetical protein